MWNGGRSWQSLRKGNQRIKIYICAGPRIAMTAEVEKSGPEETWGLCPGPGAGGSVQDTSRCFPCLSQDCLESVEPLPQPSDRTSYGNLHNLVSLGPVWRMNDRFLYKPVEGGALLVLFLSLLQKFLLSFSCCRKTASF